MLRLNLKIDNCKSNLKNIFKIGKHILCRYPLRTISAFDQVEYKHSLYRGEDCMKKFCTSLKQHATNAIHFEKEKEKSIIKELAKEFEGQLECSGENTEIYKTPSISIAKEVRKFDKEKNEEYYDHFWNKNILIMRDLQEVHYHILFIIMQWKFTKLNVEIVINCFLKYQTINKNLIKYKYLSCNRNY